VPRRDILHQFPIGSNMLLLRWQVFPINFHRRGQELAFTSLPMRSQRTLLG
jgi:hypothetical protein